MAAPTLYRYAGGHVDVTPARPVSLAGFAARRGASRRSWSPLEGNFVALWDTVEQPVIFVSLDFLYPGLVADRLRTEAERLEVGLVLTASHTHFAPATEPMLPALGRLDDDYLDDALDRIVAVLRHVAAGVRAVDAQVCSIGESTIPCPGSVNRRRRVRTLSGRTKVRALPDRRGPRDDQVRCLVVREFDTETVTALLWNYACHPVGFPDQHAVTSEFPGATRAAVRQAFGDVPVAFLQGLAGDLRPDSVDPFVPRTAGQWRRRLRLGHRGFAAFSATGWAEWSDAVAEQVLRCVGQAGRPVAGALRVHQEALPLAQLFAGVPEKVLFTMLAVEIGSDTVMVGVSAEAVVGWLPLIVAAFPGRHVIPVAYINRTVGYLPTDEVLAGGGYEGGGFLRTFGVPWRMEQRAPAVVAEALARLALRVQ